MDAKFAGFIGFILGTVVGGIATFFAVQNKFDQRLEKEIAEFKAFYVDDSFARSAENDADDDEEETDDEEEFIIGDVTDIPQAAIDAAAAMGAVVRTGNGTNERTDYAKTISEEGYLVAEDNAKKPYVITADDYFNPMGKQAEYTRKRVYYDSENGEIYDEEGNYLEDTDASVGYFNTTGISEGNQNTVFVCNEAEEILYEVCNDDPVM